MNLFTADVGQGKVHVYDSGRDQFHEKLPQETLVNLNIPGLQKGDILAMECAHLRESHRFTLAQPFHFDQLEEMKKTADRMGVSIKLFPQKSTPKTRKLYRGVNEETGETIRGFELQKSDAKFKKLYGMSPDEADTRSIAQFLLNDKKAFNALKEFFPKKLNFFKEEIRSVVEYIKECNADINPAKSSEYGFGKIEYEDEVSKWINKYALKLTEYLDGDMELIHAVGLEFDSKGKIKVKIGNRIYTIVHSILRPNGELRFRPDRANLPIDDKYKVPLWQYIKAHYLGCKPYHMNQGVAASNYKHWWRRTVSEYAYPGKKSAQTSDFQAGMSYEELAKLKEARTKVDKMTQKIWYALRKMIVEDGLR
tara:strand:+ start:195 stop:1292 length:1098 start_codon:yes stop_codon:yes gene_type:complete